MPKGQYEQRLEKDLESIRKRIRRMGRSVVAAIRNATKSVLSRDEALATDTILGDLPINRQDRDLDERCHVFIARHLPSAGHLRFISAAMRLSKTLERAGDYAETIARAALQFTTEPPDSIKRDIQELGQHAADLLEDALEAFDKRRVVDARAHRHLVNKYVPVFDRVFADLVEAGRTGKRPIEDLFALAAVSNRLERIIHQSKNIAEQTLFAETGERKAEKTFDFLFVDRAGAGASLLAAGFARKAYADAGTFRCAGWSAASEPDEAFVEFADSKGIDLNITVPASFDDIRTHMDDFEFVVDLDGGIQEHVRKVPFHTTILRWPLENAQDPVEVHRQLVEHMSDLMETLRGASDD